MKQIAAALATMALGMLSVVFVSSAGAASSVPFSDPSAAGKITLCNTVGQAVTTGSIHTKPFVWTAVGSSAAPAGYQQQGKASLFAFQPINGVAPSYWFGQYVTQAAKYTNSQRPMAGASAVDPSLNDYLQNYPTKWDGLIELRLFLSAPGQATITTRYDSAVLRVSGDTWTLLDGGSDGCDSGKTKPDEWIVPSISAQGTPAANATTDASGMSPSPKSGTIGGGTSSPGGTQSLSLTPHPSGSSNDSSSPGSDARSSAFAAGTAADGTDTPSAAATVRATSSGSSAWIWILIGVVLLGGGAGYLLMKRRGHTGEIS
jgi:LPXTG-motif cell wall-anchored protein